MTLTKLHKPEEERYLLRLIKSVHALIFLATEGSKIKLLESIYRWMQRSVIFGLTPLCDDKYFKKGMKSLKQAIRNTTPVDAPVEVVFSSNVDMFQHLKAEWKGFKTNPPPWPSTNYLELDQTAIMSWEVDENRQNHLPQVINNKGNEDGSLQEAQKEQNDLKTDDSMLSKKEDQANPGSAAKMINNNGNKERTVEQALNEQIERKDYESKILHLEKIILDTLFEQFHWERESQLSLRERRHREEGWPTAFFRHVKSLRQLVVVFECSLNVFDGWPAAKEKETKCCL